MTKELETASELFVQIEKWGRNAVMTRAYSDGAESFRNSVFEISVEIWKSKTAAMPGSNGIYLQG